MTQSTRSSAYAATDLSTPCTGVCTLDVQGLCMGCFRSGNEIAAWLSLSEPQRLAIMDQLPARKDAYFA